MKRNIVVSILVGMTAFAVLTTSWMAFQRNAIHDIQYADDFYETAHRPLPFHGDMHQAVCDYRYRTAEVLFDEMKSTMGDDINIGLVTGELDGMDETIDILKSNHDGILFQIAMAWELRCAPGLHATRVSHVKFEIGQGVLSSALMRDPKLAGNPFAGLGIMLAEGMRESVSLMVESEIEDLWQKIVLADTRRLLSDNDDGVSTILLEFDIIDKSPLNLDDIMPAISY